VHIAVIAGNDEALKELIAAGATLDVFDKSRWTPLHHATLLGREKQVEMLMRAGANVTCESLTGGTIRDILSCLKPFDREESAPIPLLGERGEKRLTQGEFKQLTGATFVLETHLTPEMMFGEWKDAVPYKSELPFEEKYTKQYGSFCQNPPVHRLKKVTHDSRGAALLSSPGLGLFASRNFKCGELIGEYKGFFTTERTVNLFALAYKNGKGIDALAHRNDIPHINDGFINVVLIPGRCIAGLSVRDLFVTADKINADDQFCWNYGHIPHLKVGFPYAELRPKEARAFMKQHKLIDLEECLDKVAEKTCSFEEYVKAEKFRYILQTPSVIFLMVFDGTIGLDICIELLATSVSMNYITREEIEPLVSLPEVVNECIKMRQLLQKAMPCLTKKYDPWITSLPARAGLAFALDMARHANTYLLRLMTKLYGKIVEEQALQTYWDMMEEAQLKLIKRHLERLTQFIESNRQHL
jgi:hypothetical protein